MVTKQRLLEILDEIADLTGQAHEEFDDEYSVAYQRNLGLEYGAIVVSLILKRQGVTEHYPIEYYIAAVRGLLCLDEEIHSEYADELTY